jgi:hypothetical protein
MRAFSPFPLKESRSVVMRSGGIDRAALAAATLAGAISLMGPVGPYLPPSMVMRGTLLALLYGYDSHPDREPRQSFAFSAVSGLCWILFLGFPLEYIFSRGSLDPTVDHIPGDVPFIVWFLFGLGTFLVDRWRLTKNRGTSDKNQARAE